MKNANIDLLPAAEVEIRAQQLCRNQEKRHQRPMKCGLFDELVLPRQCTVQDKKKFCD